MTIDEAIARAAVKLDAILERRRDELWLRMIADGCTDPDGMDEVIEMQREVDASWREASLQQLREWIIADARENLHS